MPLALELLLPWMGLLSVGSLALTASVLPWVVVRLPADYFLHDSARDAWQDVRTPLALAGRLVRNGLGLVFFAAGAAMLVLLDFPGKFRIERWIVGRGGMLRALNAPRARFGAEPLLSRRVPG